MGRAGREAEQGGEGLAAGLGGPVGLPGGRAEDGEAGAVVGGYGLESVQRSSACDDADQVAHGRCQQGAPRR